MVENCWYREWVACKDLLANSAEVRIFLVNKPQDLDSKNAVTVKNRKKVVFKAKINPDQIRGTNKSNVSYLLLELWLSFVQAICRFFFPIVKILYASSADVAQICFNPVTKKNS